MAENSERRFPTWLVAVILVFGGGLLGFTSCGAALGTGLGGGKYSTFWSNVFAAGFFAGSAAFLAGLILVLVLAIRAIFSR